MLRSPLTAWPDAAAGTARIFGTPAVLILVQPDGQLRRTSASREQLVLAITDLVNDVLQRYHPNIIASLCVALVDPPTGDLELVNCGHIPPLIVFRDAPATYCCEGGLILGLPRHDAYVERMVLPVGATALLITDGLVEDRRAFLDENMEKLRLAAQDVSGADLEAFTNHLMALFGPREDDVAMIALRLSGTA
jgi:serine phosphatase RsbU (regulator of sigma subunit)